jgi:hypothetical protein
MADTVNNGNIDVASKLLTPVICTGQFAPACEKAGIN